MVKLIVGRKGTGKTKALIRLVNDASKTSKGNVVCIERGDSLKFDLTYHIRLIDIKHYDIFGAEAYYGFIAGLLAGNYDITDLFGDATLRTLCGKAESDFEMFATFVDKVAKLTADDHTTVTFTVSCDPDMLPERIRKYIVQHQ